MGPLLTMDRLQRPARKARGWQSPGFMAAALVMFMGVATAHAHDAWLEAPPIAQPGDAVTVNLKLGNHGNNHRDFKIAGKASVDDATLVAIAPDGVETSLLDRIQDVDVDGESWRSATLQVQTPGAYLLAYTSDKVVSYAPKRSIKSAKAIVRVDVPDAATPTGFDRALGHALELLPLTLPAPGQRVRVRLLFHGKPMPGAVVSFIPQGATLAESFDPRYERVTDQRGEATFNLEPAKLHLIVAHHEDTTSGPGYTATKYAATLTAYGPPPATACDCCED